MNAMPAIAHSARRRQTAPARRPLAGSRRSRPTFPLPQAGYRPQGPRARPPSARPAAAARAKWFFERVAWPYPRVTNESACSQARSAPGREPIDARGGMHTGLRTNLPFKVERRAGNAVLAQEVQGDVMMACWLCRETVLLWHCRRRARAAGAVLRHGAGFSDTRRQDHRAVPGRRHRRCHAAHRGGLAEPQMGPARHYREPHRRFRKHRRRGRREGRSGRLHPIVRAAAPACHQSEPLSEAALRSGKIRPPSSSWGGCQMRSSSAPSRCRKTR